MDKAAQTRFIAAVDAFLLPLGFRHRKSKNDWRKREDASNESWIHINFGLSAINPSHGVTYKDLEPALPKEFDFKPVVCHMLSTHSGASYNSLTEPSSLAADIVRYGVTGITRLLDRSAVIEELKVEKAPDWPVFGASARMRLLPILLAAQGNVAEAHGWVSHFEETQLHRDQQFPTYSEFATAFRDKYAG